ncbi:MAG: preprotein translocase subunit SecY [bacterium]
MWEKISQIWRIREVRKKILIVLGILVVFRIAAHIPIPGVNVGELKDFFGSNQFLGLLNIFSGGALENFSIVMLGVGPYITASIIFQLLTMIIPKLQAIQQEGERGQKMINQWTRLLTIPLAVLQGYSTIILLRQQGQGIIGDLSAFDLATALITITAGTVFLMWLGELISEQKVGNGISLIIFAGIVAQIPLQIQQSIATFDPAQIFTFAIFIFIALVTVAGVVFVTEAQRNIPVSYARRVRGTRVYGGVNTHLPLRVNQAGVIPIIFAVSLVLIPSLIAQFFVSSTSPNIANIANWFVSSYQKGPVYAIFYFILVFAFTYFYTSVVFHPNQIAENLQKQGGFIPGIRPGRNTMDYLSYVSNRIILGGALFLGVVAVLPSIMQQFTPTQSLIVGGTSLLIVVSVVIETVKQIDAQLTVRDYEGF